MEYWNNGVLDSDTNIPTLHHSITPIMLFIVSAAWSALH
jgi:hypothetical protein